MKYKEFNEILSESAAFNIPNHADSIAIDNYIVTKQKTPTHIFVQRLLVSMASLVVVMILSFYVYLRVTPVTTLTIDINPSMVVRLNAFNRVVSIEGIDAESEAFVDGLHVANKPIDILFDRIYQKALDDAYLTADDAYALIGIYGEDVTSETEILTLVEAFDNITFLTVLQHDFSGFDIDNVIFKDSDYRTSEGADAIFEGSIGQDTIPENPDASYDGVEISIDANALYAYATENDISQTKLIIAIDIFNRSDLYQTEADFTALVALDIEQLMTIYDSLQ